MGYHLPPTKIDEHKTMGYYFYGEGRKTLPEERFPGIKRNKKPEIFTSKRVLNDGSRECLYLKSEFLDKGCAINRLGLNLANLDDFINLSIHVSGFEIAKQDVQI